MMLATMSLRHSATVVRRCAFISCQNRWRSLVVRSFLASKSVGAHVLPTSCAPSFRYFSSSSAVNEATINDDDEHENKPIRILFGSQGGTAQIFSMQLADALDESFPNRPVETFGLHEHCKNLSSTLDPNSINVILTSVAGVGEPPDNARDFYEWLMSSDANADDWDTVEYTVFGLGNQQAHPNHFNIIGKNIDTRLQELGATRIHEMGLGDDGQCIEDDFDQWLEQFLQSLSSTSTSTGDALEESKTIEETIEATPTEMEATAPSAEEEPQVSVGRIVSPKYPQLTLEQPQTDVVREDLFHLQTTAKPFYQSDCEKLSVTGNRLLSVRSAEYGLREMIVDLPPNTKYESGDHFVMYPKNAHCLVEAYLELLQGVDSHAVIQEPADNTSGKQYPFPTGITVYETLQHCVDLGSVPSPPFARELLGRKDIDYKNDIANPRRTVLDLALESKRPVSLEELLFNITPMQPRYYSIASSPLVHPNQVYLTYRPVKYVSSRGAIREGTCTTYMSNLADSSEIVGTVRSNPTFRLPADSQAPVLLMAGGCGIAAIRAFLEERLAQAGTETFGPGFLFLGFRSPSDEVYRDLVDKALETGVLTNAQVSYTSGCVKPEQQCRLVSDTVRANGKHVWELFESGGYTYLCGGARTFGAAIENEVMDIIQEHGNMSEEEAVAYLRQLIHEGRFCEDLAD